MSSPVNLTWAPDLLPPYLFSAPKIRVRRPIVWCDEPSIVIAATRPSLNRHFTATNPTLTKMGKKSKRKTKTKPPVVVDDVTITSDEVLFKDPPAKEDCPICFLPMPVNLVCCVSLPSATLTSVPIYDFVIANKEMANKHSYHHTPCCGKSICGGCVHSLSKSGNNNKCPFCNSESKEEFEDTLKRVEANDPASICLLAKYYLHGREGLQQNKERAMELYKQAAGLGSNDAHFQLGYKYNEGGDLKKAKLHLETAAMAGHEGARCVLGIMENKSGNMERAIKHWKIAASAGDYVAMHALITFFKKGTGSRKAIKSTLVAYNNTCAEMRSEARDTYIHTVMERL